MIIDFIESKKTIYRLGVDNKQMFTKAMRLL